jgi:sugar lactone lactonase YvrE
VPPDIRSIGDGRDQLGECPVWDDRAGELLHVDIARGRVHAWSPATGATRVEAHDGEVGAVVLRSSGEGVVVAVERELRLAAGGSTRRLAAVEAELEGTRFNDCRCDPQGRLWAGTMSRTREHGVAALYRLVAGGEIARVLAGLTISNGIGWSPAGDGMHYVDSTTQRIVTYDFDGGDGTIGEPRLLAAIDPSDGLPDGLAVDREGGVWVCLFGGGALRRYDPGARWTSSSSFRSRTPRARGSAGRTWGRCTSRARAIAWLPRSSPRSRWQVRCSHSSRGSRAYPRTASPADVTAAGSRPAPPLACRARQVAPGDARTSPGRGTGGNAPMHDHRSDAWRDAIAAPGTRMFEDQRLLLLELVVDPPAGGDRIVDLAVALGRPRASVRAAANGLVTAGLAELARGTLRASAAARAFEALWPVRLDATMR